MIYHYSSSHLIKFDFRIPMDICIPFTKWYRVILAIHPILWDDEACFSWGIWTKSSMTFFISKQVLMLSIRKQIYIIYLIIYICISISIYISMTTKMPTYVDSQPPLERCPPSLANGMGSIHSRRKHSHGHRIIGSENRSGFWMAFWDGASNPPFFRGRKCEFQGGFFQEYKDLHGWMIF